MKRLSITIIFPWQSIWGKHPFVKVLGLVIVFCIFSIQAFSRDAPVTTSGSAGLCQAGAITIPVTVVNFTSVSSISLRIEYDPTVMTYSSFIPNAQLTTMIVNDVHISANLHKLMAVWAETTPRTFTNGTSLVTLSFTYISGTTALTFNNTSNSGGDCEYADENGDPMNDTPTATYYMNSIVQTVPLQNTLTNITVGNGQSATYKATQTISAAGSGAFFTIQNGGSAIMVAGQNIQFMPGTMVQSEGYLHALISDPCIFPNIPQPQITSKGRVEGSSVESIPKSAMKKEMVKIYPNPTTGLIHPDFSKLNTTKGLGEIVIYSSTGKAIQKIRIDLTARGTSIDLTGNPPGIYLMMLSLEGGDRTMEKIVMQ